MREGKGNGKKVKRKLKTKGWKSEREVKRISIQIDKSIYKQINESVRNISEYQ